MVELFGESHGKAINNEKIIEKSIEETNEIPEQKDQAAYEDDTGSKGQEKAQEDGSIANNIQQVAREEDLSPRHVDISRNSTKKDKFVVPLQVVIRRNKLKINSL